MTIIFFCGKIPALFSLLSLAQMATENAKKSVQIFECESCDYLTCKLWEYKRHCSTHKHLRNTLATPSNKKSADVAGVTCEFCNKEYADRTGLWRHKNKGECMKNTLEKMEVTAGPHDTHDKDELILELLKQNAQLIKENSDFKNMMMKVIENGTTNHSHNTTHTNSHNKAFNLQFFLNETCKNAMNITDFIDSIKLQLSDLMDVGELGYVEGISNIIVKNLNNLDETERPIHCTDKKRETFYVKDQGHWEKEDHEKKQIKKVIRNVAFKNERLLQKYKEEHPGCNYSESKYSDEYSKLVIEAMGGPGNDGKVKEEKIIKNISKATTINDK